MNMTAWRSYQTLLAAYGLYYGFACYPVDVFVLPFSGTGNLQGARRLHDRNRGSIGNPLHGIYFKIGGYFNVGFLRRDCGLKLRRGRYLCHKKIHILSVLFFYAAC